MILLLTNSTKHTRLVSGVLRVSEPQGSLVFPVKLFLPLLEGRKADLPLASFSCWTPPPWSYYHYLTKTGGHFRRSNEKLNSHMSNIHGKGPIADCNNKHWNRPHFHTGCYHRNTEESIGLESRHMPNPRSAPEVC